MLEFTFMGIWICRVARTIALPLLLCACALPLPVKQEPMTAERPRSYSDVIDLSGRLSVRYLQNGQEEAVHGSFVWSQTAGHTRVTLSSPFGQTLAVIEATPFESILRRPGQPSKSARDADSLVVEALGWPLPLAGLHQWLQGIANGVNGEKFVATQQNDQVTTDDGWHIRYFDWADENATAKGNRPKRINLERHKPPLGHVAIRIIIDQWQPG